MLRNLDKFFLNNSSTSKNELIDESFFSLKIPGARTLYKEIIDRDEFTLISPLTWGQIQSFFPANNYKVEDYFKEIDSKQLSPTLNLHTLHLKKSNNQQEFSCRRKILAELKRLRYEFLPPDGLFLDADTPIHLHFSDSKRLDFKNSEVNQIPLAYRALCIYDLIVDHLYRFSINNGEVFKDNLIGNFLIIHNDQVKPIKNTSSSEESGDDTRFTLYENKDLTLIQMIIHSFKYMCFDNKSAELLNSALEETIEIDAFNKVKKFTHIPLTPEAYLDYESGRNKTDPFLGLTKRSHYYASLIQYRYLLDLKLFAFANTKLNITKLESEKEKIVSHMNKWNDFKNQANLFKCESLIAKINIIPREKEEHSVGMWDSCYWEEFISVKGEKGILIKALNTRNETNLLTQSFAIKIQNELKDILNVIRFNDYQKNDFRYKFGYSIFIKWDDFIKCPLDALLVSNEHIITAFKNIPLTKIILTDQGFFQTKKPSDWQKFLKEQGLYKNDLKSFIWNLATWSKMKDWLMDKKDKQILPNELLSLIINFHGKLLEQANSSLGCKRKW